MVKLYHNMMLFVSQLISCDSKYYTGFHLPIWTASGLFFLMLRHFPEAYLINWFT